MQTLVDYSITIEISEKVYSKNQYRLKDLSKEILRNELENELSQNVYSSNTKIKVNKKI